MKELLGFDPVALVQRGVARGWLRRPLLPPMTEAQVEDHLAGRRRARVLDCMRRRRQPRFRHEV